jgi:hypothetical protein
MSIGELPMNTFVRVCEIWVPSKYRTELEFHSGLYGELQQFRVASERMCFGYDEGLPGKAWAERHPIVLKDLQHSYFKRAEAARQAGLTCGIAIPVFAGDYLLAVVVLYCGDDEEYFGAIELWHAAGGGDLALVDGYYAELWPSGEARLLIFFNIVEIDGAVTGNREGRRGARRLWLEWV